MRTIRYTLSLSEPLDNRIKNMAYSLGLPVATFIRFLLVEEVKKSPIPIFVMSEETEKIIAAAEKDYTEGKLAKFDSIKDMFDNLEKKH